MSCPAGGLQTPECEDVAEISRMSLSYDYAHIEMVAALLVVNISSFCCHNVLGWRSYNLEICQECSSICPLPSYTYQAQ